MKSLYLYCEFLFNQLSFYCQTNDKLCKEHINQMKQLNCHDYGFYYNTFKQEDDTLWFVLSELYR